MSTRVSMYVRLIVFLSAAVATMLCLAPSELLARQTAKRAADIELPPISYTCPMVGVTMPDGTVHPDVIEDKGGPCPICKMELVAVRLDSVFTCPVHAIIIQKNPGTCPIDHRDLVPVTMAVSWGCKGETTDHLEPGKCSDGSTRAIKYTARAHGNHNPQHGGQFFMAPDNWTHLEGTFPQPGLVRVFLYDDFAKPLSLDRAKTVTGRIVTKETFNAATHTSNEISAFPLTLAKNGKYLEAKIDSRTVPAPMAAKVKVKPDGPEYRFDFSFTDFSKEPAPGAAASVQARPPAPVRTSPAAPAAAPAGTATAAQPTTAAVAPPAQKPPVPPEEVDPLLNPASFDRSLPIPGTLPEIVAMLSDQTKQISGLIDKGQFNQIWIPAFQAKDLGLAMGGHAAQLPAYKRNALEPAVKRLLHWSWMLDALGDLGNRDEITKAYGYFNAAVLEIEAIIQGNK